MAQQPSHTDAAESGLKQASEEVKLAVDLIYLLETHEIAPEVALAALDIVKQDLQGKLNKK
ncbi:pleiotropic regulatory protein RsmS [Shewanella psychrotolerans]|uniref:pleiotropic regulatory protein RsmS n=1 Tax=Shewanella psychrotolerans TaxID=2864206 RepID=UPI001C65EFF8|nr:pleiotropic regulatory protein RsmS [Shewanella psychrotolerans]QYK00410.1 pleiotropic regulatory protein RsmS [Shewanella psychrotolerans]